MEKTLKIILQSYNKGIITLKELIHAVEEFAIFKGYIANKNNRELKVKVDGEIVIVKVKK